MFFGISLTISGGFSSKGPPSGVPLFAHELKKTIIIIIFLSCNKANANNVGFVDLDYTSTPTTDTLTMTDEDFTNPDTQGSYTGSRFLTSFTQIADGDANIVMESVNESVWYKCRYGNRLICQ